MARHDDPENVENGHIEEILHLDRLALLLSEEVCKAVRLFQQHALQALLAKAEVLQSLQYKSSLALPLLPVVENESDDRNPLMFEDVYNNSPQFTTKHAEPVDEAVWPPGDNILVEEVSDILVVVEDHCRVGAQVDSHLGRIKVVNYITTSKLFAERV